MRPTSLSPWTILAPLTLAAGLGLTSSAHAQSPDELLRDAAAALDSARAANQSSGLHCADHVGHKIGGILKQLQRSGGSIDALNATRGALDALTLEADASCPPPLRATITRLMFEALVRIELVVPAPGGGNGYVAPPPVVHTETSFVDTQCLRTLRDAYPYQADRDTIVEWLAQCRSGVAASACAAMSSAPDAACAQAATSAYPYQLDAGTQSAFLTACTRYECQLPPGNQLTQSTVDAGCVAQQASTYPYQASAEVIVNWVRGCRVQAGGGCTQTSRAFDASCFAVAKAHYPYQADRATLQTFGNACEIERFICP